MIKLIKNILLNNYFQSISIGFFLTLFLFLVWDPEIQKYTVDVNPTTFDINYDCKWVIDDFDNDGNTEYLRFFKSQHTDLPDIVVYNKNFNVHEHWHFNHDTKFYKFLGVNTFDLDGNGVKDLVFFSIRNDSIFINAVDLNDFSFVIEEKYFDSFEKKRELDYACTAEISSYGDYNNDGQKELFFSFDAGFGLRPRGIFKIEFPSLKISKSHTEYMGLGNLKIYDFDYTNTPLIYTNCYAPGNVGYNTHCNYSDSICYLAVFDYDLNFLFAPKAYNGKFSSLGSIPDPLKPIVYVCYSGSDGDSKMISIDVIDLKGQVINSRKWKLNKNQLPIKSRVQIQNNKPYLIIKELGRIELTPSLEHIPYEIEDIENSIVDRAFGMLDISGDGIEELFVRNRDEIIIYNERIDETIEFKAPIELNSGCVVSPILDGGKLLHYAITNNETFFTFQYLKNQSYALIYLFNAIIFLSISSIIFLLLFVQKKATEKKLHTEKQLSELQFNAIKNQLNPHFLFNALNSVAYMIHEGQKEKAFDFLTLNSRMIQRVMEGSKEVKCSLESELAFTSDYIAVQKQRFKDRFSTEIVVEKDVDLNFEIPKMCIHTYVENAIKHGFRQITKGGELIVHVQTIIDGISIEIIDNGVGRKEASKYKDSTKKGLLLLNEFYMLFEKYYAYKISCTIIDNIFSKNRTGTIVELKIRTKKS